MHISCRKHLHRKEIHTTRYANKIAEIQLFLGNVATFELHVEVTLRIPYTLAASYEHYDLYCELQYIQITVNKDGLTPFSGILFKGVFN